MTEAEEKIKNQARGLLVLIIIAFSVYIANIGESKTPDTRLDKWYTVQNNYRALSDKGVLQDAITAYQMGYPDKFYSLQQRDGYTFLQKGDKVKVLEISDDTFPISYMKVKRPNVDTTYWTSQEAVFLGSRDPNKDDSDCFIRVTQGI